MSRIDGEDRLRTQCRTCGIVWEGEVTTCPNCGEVITVVELPPSEIGRNLRDLVFWFLVGGFPGLFLGAILNSKQTESEVKKITDNLKIGLASAIVGAITWNLVVYLQLAIIPARLLPSGLSFHANSTLEYVILVVGSSYLLAWIFGIPFSAFYDKIPTSNAFSKSLILTLGLPLLLLVSNLLFVSDESIYSFLFRLAFDIPPFAVLGLTMGLVFEKLKNRIDNRETVVELDH